MHCGASVSELYRVYSMVVTYILHYCKMHNAQYNIYTNLCIGSLGRAPSPISLWFVNLSCLCSAVSAARQALSLVLVCAVAGFPCLAMVSELFWKYYMFTTSSKPTINLTKKHVFPIRSRAKCPYAARIRVHWTYVRYIYIHICGSPG